jgi:hypothetical protein
MSATDLVAASRNRSVVGRFAGHRAAAGRLSLESATVERRELPGLAGRVDAVGQPAVVSSDWYVGARDQADLVLTYQLRADARGDFVLRAVKTDAGAEGRGVTLSLVAELMEDEVLVAVDAATSQDPRERGVAMRILGEALEQFRAGA